LRAGLPVAEAIVQAARSANGASTSEGGSHMKIKSNVKAGRKALV